MEGINKQLEEIFEEIADMLSLDANASRFEVNAYRNAALTIGSMQEDASAVYAKGGIKALMELPGIGKGIAEKIEEYIKTGHIKKYEMLKKAYPINFKELTSINGLGPKKIAALYSALKVTDLKTLKEAVESHKVRELSGFGAKSEQEIEESISMLEESKGRILLGEALPVAEGIVKKLLESGFVDTAAIAGSTRRMKETVGDIDILATSTDGEKAMDFFSSLDEVGKVMLRGPTKETVWLKIGTTCDLRIVKPESFGAAMQYFTGSKEHNVEVRKIAIKKGYKLNEYGLFQGSKSIAGDNEEEVYRKIGMQLVPPEMRENKGEIELAKNNEIPSLISYSDLHGDMHTHTKETDGMNTLEEMAEEARLLGHEYFATTNHTKSLKVAHGMDDRQFAEFFKQVDRLNEMHKYPYILKGAEVDILKDGRLDLERKTLESMDCVIASIHSNFSMNEKEMTARIIKAIDSGLVNIIGHPTGRIINERNACQVDLEKIADAAEANNVALEINAFINRLDLNGDSILALKEHKVMFAIGSDAHQRQHMHFLRYGIGMARRGWLEKYKVINTLPLNRLLEFLHR